MDSACEIWPGARNQDGYGVTTVEGRWALAHRATWAREHGAIPEGMCVLHRCDEPGCVNLDHLWIGTQADNMADRKAKGRWAGGRPRGSITKTRCKNGHEAYYRSADGRRRCRECERMWDRERRGR